MKMVAPVVVTAMLFHGIAAAQATDDEIVTLASRPDVTVSFAVTRPDGETKAAAILFSGGNGKLRLWHGKGLSSGNFLVRARALFAKEGVLAVTVDIPSDRREDGLDDVRGSADHVNDIAAVLRWVRAQTKTPVWLIGTSRGSVSVAHLAGRLPVDGVVLTASVTRASRRRLATVHDAALETVTVPVLLVHHRQDPCHVTPADDIPALAARFRGAARLETLLFEGGRPAESRPCRAKSAHGFFGIEEQVVGAIVRWMIAAATR